MLLGPCFSRLLGTGYGPSGRRLDRCRATSQSAARPSAIPAVTRAAFSSWALARSLQRLPWQLCRTARCWLYSHRDSSRAIDQRLGGLWSPVNSPGRWGDFPFECLIAFGAADRFRLVYPWIVDDNRVRPSNDEIVIAGSEAVIVHNPGMLGRARDQRRNTKEWMHTGAFSDSGRCSKGCRRARQWRLRRWPGTAFERRTPFRS